MACITLGKPKKLNFLIWVRLGEKFMKDPVWWCGGGVVVVWFGLVWFFVIIIPTSVWVFDLDFDWGVAKRKENCELSL